MAMKKMRERLERIEIEESVHIPTIDGEGIAETIKVQVPAWRDPKDGEIYLATEATAIIDKTKARHMGLLKPQQIKALRERLGLKQREISELLQIGEKTWTRWETGRERPMRSINVVLWALLDAKIDVAYLKHLARRRTDWADKAVEPATSLRYVWADALKARWQEAGTERGHQIPESYFSQQWQSVPHFSVSPLLAEDCFQLLQQLPLLPEPSLDFAYNPTTVATAIFAFPESHEGKRQTKPSPERRFDFEEIALGS
jgi:DNA-binding transcriptional regulator YiaG